MKGMEQYFPVVLFILLYKVVLNLNLWMKPWRVTIQIKAIKQHFDMVLFILLYKVVLKAIEQYLLCITDNLLCNFEVSNQIPGYSCELSLTNPCNKAPLTRSDSLLFASSNRNDRWP